MNNQTFALLEIAQRQFDQAADLLSLDQPARDLLRMPMREYHFSIPIQLDNGDHKVFRGFRVQHNDALGPCKGGFRFHPLQTIDTIRALAMWMTWRSAVASLPLGGSMGGVICDPHDLSFAEQEKICRGWVRKISRELGPTLDIPSPDIMTNDTHMIWMLDEYETIHNLKAPGFITGKPVGLGGSFGRKEATGYGLIIAVREALKELGVKPEDTTASIQGFGSVAQNAFQLYERLGGKVISVSSWDQQEKTAFTFRKKDGVNFEELHAITNTFGEIDKNLAKAAGYEVLPSDAWLEQKVDILIPAAIEGQITLKNVARINDQVRIIVEGANGPMDLDAEAVVEKKHVLVIPDLLANAGGAICSYFEQVQSGMNYYWKKDEVLGKLDAQMTTAYMDVSEFARSNSYRLRDAAYVIAVDRVARACQKRSWV